MLRTGHSLLAALALCSAATAFNARNLPGAESYVVPAEFPTEVFPNYYVRPASTCQPQPALFDPVLNYTFPRTLTDPLNVPSVNTDSVFYPLAIANVEDGAAELMIQDALAQIRNLIFENTELQGNCTKCLAALKIGKSVAQYVPSHLPQAMISLCKETGFKSEEACEAQYAPGAYGAIWAQVLSLADVEGPDGQYICHAVNKRFCPAPATRELNMTGLFPKPKPAHATAPAPSGKRVKVLHLSDFHLDARYQAASEAACSKSMCCRHSDAATSPLRLPAPLFGSFKCDTPYYLATAALQSIASLTGTGTKYASPAWSLYTGDLISHDPLNQVSKEYIEYGETSVYKMLAHYIKGPIYAVLGNHDTSPKAIDARHSLPGPLGEQLSWNHKHVSGLWKHHGWIDEATADQAALHYAGYSVKNQHGLRIITLNTDFWYNNNYLNLINATDADSSGTFRFLIDELQAAEDARERVWITGHILSGWDGRSALPDPSNLFYQIVDRYSPHVIAGTFWGHTHEDQTMIYYANNGTVKDASTALMTGWIGPSVTPLTNLNSGYRMYEVDTGSFEIYDAYTFYSNVSTYPALNATGPTFQLEYSTREAYGSVIGWPETAPLNATFWHQVTVAMESNRTMVEVFNKYQGKSSIKITGCASDECAAARVCYMRSGSTPLARECPAGYGFVQDFKNA